MGGSVTQDFLGNPYQVGGFVAAGGAGNRSAEYGMILYQVLAIEPKLRLTRLTVSYPTYNADNIVIGTYNITVQNTNKYVVVDPSADLLWLWSKAIRGMLTREEESLISSWIHGKSVVPWETK